AAPATAANARSPSPDMPSTFIFDIAFSRFSPASILVRLFAEASSAGGPSLPKAWHLLHVEFETGRGGFRALVIPRCSRGRAVGAERRSAEASTTDRRGGRRGSLALM